MRPSQTRVVAAMALALVAACGPKGAPPAVALVLSTSSVAFVTATGASPAPQTVTASGQGDGTLAVPTVSVSGGGWLAVSVSGSAAPYTLTFAPSTAALPAGDYAATVTVTSAGATASPQQVAVALTIEAGGQPTLTVSPLSLTFSAAEGGVSPAAQDVTVDTSSGPTLAAPTTSISYASQAGWLSASVSGSAAPYTVTLSASTGALIAGTYTATVSIASAGARSSPRDVSVTFTVQPRGAQPVLAFGPASLTFAGKTGEADPARAIIDVFNAGSGTLGTVTASVSYGSAKSWLNVFAYADGSPNVHRVVVDATTGSLPVGTYTATLTLACAAASNGPQQIPITFNVTAGAPAMGLYPARLDFKTVWQWTSGDPPPQQVAVFNVGGGALAAPTVQVNYTTGTGWLSTSVSGTSAPYTLTVTVARSAISSAGAYSALLIVTSPGAPQKTYSVGYVLNNINANSAVHGTLKFESVAPTASGLDYSAVVQKPIRRALVEVLDATAGNVIGSTYSGDDGSYLVFFPTNFSGTQRLRVKASAIYGVGGIANVEVRDNTAAGALYELTSGTFTSADTSLDLVATTGWGGAGYTGARLAAPFAILDTLYAAGRAFLDVRPTLVFPSLVANWSPSNGRQVGDKALGEIGASHWDPAAPGGGQLYLLGKADVDTDEFDSHVIIREWVGYFEARMMGRADSPGGDSARGDSVDPRLAWSEGLGRALAAIVLDGQFKETFGAGQAQGSAYSLEDNTAQDPNPGWWSVGSVEHVIYDAVDAANEGHDAVAVGIGGLSDALLKKQKTTYAAATLFSFLRGLKALRSDQSAAIDTLAGHRGVVTTGGVALTDDWGTGETHDSGDTANLPVYRKLIPGAAAVSVTLDGARPSTALAQNRLFLSTRGGSADSASAKNVDLYGFNRGVQYGAAATTSGNEHLPPPMSGSSTDLAWVIVLTGRDQGGARYSASLSPP